MDAAVAGGLRTHATRSDCPHAGGRRFSRAAGPPPATLAKLDLARGDSWHSDNSPPPPIVKKVPQVQYVHNANIKNAEYV